MPFKSKQQAKWMFANHPQMARQWANVTPSLKTLPTKVEPEKKNNGK